MISFNLENYNKLGVAYPNTYDTINFIDKQKYAKLEQQYDPDGNGVSNTFLMLKKRTSKEYYTNILMSQSKALVYSKHLFPTYKFIMPEALLDDWLAIIDPHREGKRDHSTHQPMTAYIVSQMLGCGDPANELSVDGRTLLDRCVDLLIDENNQGTHYLRKYFCELYPKAKTMSISSTVKHKIAREVFCQTAVTSALFHDIGYPWQFTYGLSKSLLASDYVDNKQIERSADDIKQRISGRLLNYPFHGYSETSIAHQTFLWRSALDESLTAAFHNTHGFPGALAFTYLTDIVRKFPQNLSFEEAICQFIIDWAAVGIMMHDMPRQCRGNSNTPPRPQFRLSADVDPLSCLIAMSDILEEFNRPRSVFESEEKSVNVKYTYPCIETSLDVVGDELCIKYLYEDEKLVAANRKSREDEVNEYFNYSDRFINLEALGIKTVKCVVAKK